MGYLGATLTQVFTRVRGADVSLGGVTIAQMGNRVSKCEWRHAPEVRGRSGRVTQRCRDSPRWETGLASTNDVTHWKRAEDFWDFWKKLVELRLDTGREGSTFGARRDQTNLRATGAGRDGGRWHRQNRKNLYFSPYVEEPLNSKVIKKFRTWTKKS